MKKCLNFVFNLSFSGSVKPRNPECIHEYIHNIFEMYIRNIFWDVFIIHLGLIWNIDDCIFENRDHPKVTTPSLKAELIDQVGLKFCV